MRLKELRIAQKLYQKDIADILGVDRTTYTKYESGASEPDIATLIQLADFFGVTVDYLISHEENVVSEMSTMEINTIGKRIKGIRERQNLSLDDLAEKLNMSPHQLFCYEYNMATPDEQTIERIAKILKINKSCLLGSWEKDVLDDFYADLRKHPERWTDKHIMEIFETEGVPYELQSLYLSTRRNLSTDDSSNAYSDFILTAVSDKFGKDSISFLQSFIALTEQEQSVICNMLSMYLKLDHNDRIEINGEMRHMLKDKKYSSQEGFRLA